MVEERGLLQNFMQPNYLLTKTTDFKTPLFNSSDQVLENRNVIKFLAAKSLNEMWIKVKMIRAGVV